MLTTLEPVYCGTEADQSRDRDALARLHSSPVHGNQDVARAVDREPYLVSACGTGSARRVAYRLDVVGCWQGSKVGKDVIRRRAARAITGENLVNAREKARLTGARLARKLARQWSLDRRHRHRCRAGEGQVPIFVRTKKVFGIWEMKFK